jgi:AcrR family transcriptional regulator
MSRTTEITKEAILDAAITQFSRFGFKKTRLSDIAASLDISAAALFRYFTDKRALYDAAAARGLTRWQEAAFSLAASHNEPISALMALARASFDYLSDDPEFAAMLRNDPGIFPLFAGDHFETVNDASKAMIRRLIEQGQETGVFRSVDIDRVSHLFFSIYKMFIVGSYIETNTQTSREAFDQFIDIAVRGLLTERGAEAYRRLEDGLPRS